MQDRSDQLLDLFNGPEQRRGRTSRLGEARKHEADALPARPPAVNLGMQPLHVIKDIFGPLALEDDGARALVEAIEVKEGDRVLDLGCGCGTNGIMASLASGPSGFTTFVDMTR